MLLQNKKAVICGGGGAIGGAIARAFAREGAMIFLGKLQPGSGTYIGDGNRPYQF